jgi:hypothetical protein
MNFVLYGTLFFVFQNLSFFDENIHFDEPIKTKKYVQVDSKDGSNFLVPIINGYFPRIVMTVENGTPKRDFYYDSKIRYDDQNIIDSDQKEFDDLKIKYKELQKEIEDLKKKNEQLKKENNVFFFSSFYEMICKSTSSPINSGMKKPSEILGIR